MPDTNSSGDKADLIIWMREHDNAYFGHFARDGKPISHRYGPFHSMKEVTEHFSSTPNPAKDCGPILPPMLGLYQGKEGKA